MQQMRDQAERFGARFLTEDVTRIEPGSGPGSRTRSGWKDEPHRAYTVILSMGAQHKKLGVPGEEELGGRGVSYCATCDAAFYRDRRTVIVGGGDSAMEEAIFLAKFSSKVSIINRRDEFRASKIMLERARAAENIEFLTPYVVEEFLGGGPSGQLDKVRVRHVETGRRRSSSWTAPSSRSATSRSRASSRPLIDTDENGYVVVEGRSTRTNVPGIFAAGDLVDHTYRQAITAAGSGCQAALDAEWYLRDTPRRADAAVARGRRHRRAAVGPDGQRRVTDSV
jgi:thioredoxin reductase (NADPH)